MGHDRIAYGGVPDGDQVAEINIGTGDFSQSQDHSIQLSSFRTLQM
jgi:hypothetical protein